jgi:KipI family sensor histidine kinase inhibitor
MVRFDPLRISHEDVEAWLDAVGDRETPGEGKLVEIATLYIGEDLEEVARGCGLSTKQVVDLHCGRDYDAWFLGFVPGFAYLGEVDERIVTARRAKPRARVPAGSVAIAGSQTAVYPLSSPGGWNLIGVTDCVMFDVATGVALIEPGDRVRFIAK